MVDSPDTPDMSLGPQHAMPEGTIARLFDTPESRQMAEFHMMETELRMCLFALEMWIEMGNAPTHSSREITLSGCLFRDVIVQFVGCFGTDENYLHSDEVYPDEEHQAFFRWLTGVRHTFAAHRTGSLRQTAPCVMFHPPSEGGGIKSVGGMFMMFTGPSGDGRYALLEFIRLAWKYANKEAQRLSVVVEQQAKACSVDELLQAPEPKLHMAWEEDFRLTREQFIRAKAGGEKRVRRPRRARRGRRARKS